MHCDRQVDKDIEPKKKDMEGIEGPSAERDYFIIQDKLRQAVEERRRAAERGRARGMRRRKSFITYVLVSVVSIILLLLLIFLRKVF